MVMPIKDKAARKAYEAERYRRNKEDPEWLERKRERNREAAKKYRDRLRKEDPDKLREINRKQNLKYSYGLTPEDVAQMLADQGGRCKICSTPLRGDNGRTNCKKTHVVDHCHTTGKVRGILCIRCNSGLGYFRDNVEFLSRAITYLEEND